MSDANTTAAGDAFLTYATIRSPTVPFLVGLTVLLVVVLPYSWRGMLPRATFRCPSFVCAAFFVFVGTPLHFVMTGLVPDTVAGNPAAQRFFSDIKRASYLFVGAHSLLTLIRLKYTLTKWQALIICEVSKAMYAVFLLWGFSLAEPELDSPGPARGCMVAFVTFLLSLSVVRAVYAVRCQFNAERFNHAYFGGDSKCPMKRRFMCMVCEKDPTAPGSRSAAEQCVEKMSSQGSATVRIVAVLTIAAYFCWLVV